MIRGAVGSLEINRQRETFHGFYYCHASLMETPIAFSDYASLQESPNLPRLFLCIYLSSACINTHKKIPCYFYHDSLDFLQKKKKSCFVQELLSTFAKSPRATTLTDVNSHEVIKPSSSQAVGDRAEMRSICIWEPSNLWVSWLWGQYIVLQNATPFVIIAMPPTH